MVGVEVIIVVQTILIVVLQFSPALTSDFFARKMCHAGSGALMLALDPVQWEARYFLVPHARTWPPRVRVPRREKGELSRQKLKCVACRFLPHY
jgi:hypothetical protein